MPAPRIQPQVSPSRRPTRVLANFDGNLSTNYPGGINVREATEPTFGDDHCGHTIIDFADDDDD
jgi:hypothetical protein